MTLDAIAKLAGLSKPFLSQVERDLSTPSITSLSGIASALGVSFQYFVETQNGYKNVKHKRDQAFFTLDHSPMQYAKLSGSVPDRNLEILLTIIPPDTRFMEVTRHAGEEFIYVLHGELHLEVDDDAFELPAGDCAHFLSTSRHRWENRTDKETTILWVGTPTLL